MNTCKLIVSQRIFKGLSLKEIRTISYAESPTKVRNSKIRLVDNGDLKYNGNRLLFLLAQFSKMTGIGWMQGLEEPKTKKWLLCSNRYSIEGFICLALVLSADRHRCQILLEEDAAFVVFIVECDDVKADVTSFPAENDDVGQKRKLGWSIG